MLKLNISQNGRKITDAYDIRIFNVLTKIAPLVAFVAGVTFTLGYVYGLFKNTNIYALIAFDVISLVYIIVGYAANKVGVLTDGKLDENYLEKMKYLLAFLTIVQWNLISYIFPSRDFWAYAGLFILLPAFFFDTKVMLVEEFGIFLSMMVSWTINPEVLLPQPGETYVEDMTLRFVLIALVFICVYLVVKYGEEFRNMITVRTAELEKRNAELQSLNDDIIDFTADMVGLRDSDSGVHIKRVKDYTKILATQVMNDYPEYGLTPEIVDIIASASVLHDVGKVKVPDRVLLKPDRLDEDEFEIIKTHSAIGAEIVDMLPKNLDTYYSKVAKEICLYHHERWDGNGYPYGLVGDRIPIAAQIVAVADCFDAITTKRPYKQALTADKAAEMIMNGECGAFSDKLMSCFDKCKTDFALLDKTNI